MGLFDFLGGKKDNYEDLVIYYEEYIKACVLQLNIFPQIAFNGLDVINGKVEQEDIYIEQFNRLIDAVRLGNIKDKNGNEKNLNLTQELYLRITLASWIMSKINSYDNLGKKIRNEMYLGYNQLIFAVNLKNVDFDIWAIDCCVQLFKTDSDVSEININSTFRMNREIFESQNPFAVYTYFENTPKELLKTFFDLTKLLCFETPLLTNVNRDNMSIGRLYADFWLKKMIVTLIMNSKEWDNNIKHINNIAGIYEIKYNLLDKGDYFKMIQFNFNLKTINSSNIKFSHIYFIESAEVFGKKYINSLANFVSTNHNLSY